MEALATMDYKVKNTQDYQRVKVHHIHIQYKFVSQICSMEK